MICEDVDADGRQGRDADDDRKREEFERAYHRLLKDESEAAMNEWLKHCEPFATASANMRLGRRQTVGGLYFEQLVQEGRIAAWRVACLCRAGKCEPDDVLNYVATAIKNAIVGAITGKAPSYRKSKERDFTDVYGEHGCQAVDKASFDWVKLLERKEDLLTCCTSEVKSKLVELSVYAVGEGIRFTEADLMELIGCTRSELRTAKEQLAVSVDDRLSARGESISCVKAAAESVKTRRSRKGQKRRRKQVAVS